MTKVIASRVNSLRLSLSIIGEALSSGNTAQGQCDELPSRLARLYIGRHELTVGKICPGECISVLAADVGEVDLRITAWPEENVEVRQREHCMARAPC